MTDFDKNIKYKIIYADPPWKYKDSGCNGSAENHYTTMNIKEIFQTKILFCFCGLLTLCYLRA